MGLKAVLPGLLLLATFGCASKAAPLAGLRTATDRFNALESFYEPPLTETPACTAGVERLEFVAKVLEIEVIYSDIEGGMASFGSRSVVVDKKLTSCGRLEVLGHEIGHMLQPRGLTAPESQVFADAVSYLVVRELGQYDPQDRYAAYLASFKPSSRVMDVLRTEIEFVAKVLIGRTGAS